ncbi:dolichyl-phosphate-mannose-protein mannosyltransferase [Hydrogenivirga caldilitoris]|uniref:Dolichyl-phosphate-mannose-protein mannosyltransferase n=1 Tax=Hydrogenivirga caldilitoris TaxID=246264 RepID=A0A497XQ49_9AQUI|nr:glycosyltransferase family 39 protein [Hydrogenivirga caldilitoris]RLJ71116.1 dolichyl-phosphate-mannose-protein mannosyltransferase [Hydrogenivirga caldilitoris]
MSRSLALVVVLSSFFLIFGSWTLSVTSPDEGKNLDTALRMLENRDFIIPKYNCNYRFEKPPLFYWLTDVSFSLFGVNEFSGRLVSGLSAVGVDVFTYLMALESFGPEGALFSALVFDTLVHNWVEARAATPEILLTFFMTLGLYLFLKGRFRAGWVALAFAFLAKGPVGVILPVGVYLLWRRDLRLINFSGIVLFFLIGSSWYLVMLWKFGFAYFYKFFLYENIMRYTGHKSIHPYPFWYYVPVVVASSLFYLPKFPSLIRGWDRRLNPYLLWFVFVFLFYSLAKNKLHHYVLFLYPPLAIMLSRYVGRRYITAVLIVSVLTLTGLVLYTHEVEQGRFVPKAAEVLKSYVGKVYFYKTENSALVFYTRKFIEKVSSLREIEKPALVVVEERDLKDFPGAMVLLKGNEFGKKLLLIEVR